MPNPSWPVSLPAFVMRPGYSEKPGDTTMETPMDSGATKTRRKGTADIRRFTTAMQMTAAQFDDFEGFWRDDLAQGSLPFDWVHPRTRAATTLIFRKPHWSLSALPGGYVEVSMTLERSA